MTAHDDLEARLREMEDVHAIMGLEAEYARAADTVQPDLYGGVFTEDGVIELHHLGGQEPRRVVGREAIRDFCREVIGKSYQYAIHALSNHQIAVNGDTARGRIYFDATTNRLDGRKGWSAGVYEDQYVRTPQGWKIQKKVIRFLFSEA